MSPDFWSTRGGSRYFVYVDGDLWTGDGQQSSRDLGEAQDRGQQAYFEAREAGVEAPEIFITHSMERHLNVAALNAALASVNRGTTDVTPPPSTPDPSDNPNGLALLGSHPLASATGLPTFEASGATYPDDYTRFTIADTGVDGGYYHIGIGKTPSAYIGTNRIGDPDDIVIELDVAFRLRVTGDVPYKLFRSIVFAEPDWSEAAVGHVWFSQPAGTGVIASDPARGVVGSVLQTVGYNDTANFIWEGAVVGTDNLADGEWHTVRIYQKLNSAGVADGICRVWIDGVLDIEDTSINWVDSYNLEYGFNAIFLEAYHNDGSSGGTTIDFRDLYVRGATYVISPTAISVLTSSLSSGTQGASYNQTLQATGGNGTYVWTVEDGSLPSGLSLDPGTGAITGTPTVLGTSNFTVQCADTGGSTPDTVSLSIMVGAPGGGSDPFQVVNWDGYANIAAAIAGEGLAITEQGGAVSLVSGLTGTPTGFTKAVRCTYLGGQGAETTANFTVFVDQGSTRQLREIWGRYYVRFEDGFTTNGPNGGNPDLKFLFLFDQTPSGSRRWETNVGVFGDNYGQYIAGNGDNLPGADDLFDGVWEEVRFHAKFGTNPASGGTAIWKTRFHTTGITRTWPGGVDATFPGFYYNQVTFLANLNRGSSTDLDVDHGPIELFDFDPGWGTDLDG